MRVSRPSSTYIIVVAVEVVTLAVHAPTALRHFAGDAPLLGQVLVDLLARLVAHHFRREEACLVTGLLTLTPPSASRGSRS